MKNIVILIVVSVIVLMGFLNVRDIWDVDEGQHAETSQEMIRSGDWITPHSNGEVFFDKTPLFNWFVAVSFLLFGYSAFAARLPAALLGIGCVLACYILGKRMFSPRAGFFSGLALVSSPLFIILSRSVVHDISLTFFITLALLFFFTAYKTPEKRRLHMLLTAGSAGFAVLAKGPIGVLLPGMVIFIFLVLQRDLKFIREMSLGWCALVFLAIVVPWYALIMIRNPEYARYFFVKQNLMSFLSAKKSRHPEPIYFYLPILAGGLFPWIFTLPVFVSGSFRKIIRQRRDELLFLTVWVLGITCFFSTAQSKLPTYILPVFPAAALLSGYVWDTLSGISIQHPEKHLRIATLPTALILTGAVIYGILFPPLKLKYKYGIALPVVYILAGILMFLSWTAVIALLKKRSRMCFYFTSALMPAAFLYFILVVTPEINPYRSTKILGLELDRQLPTGEKLVFYRDMFDSAMFYTGRHARIINNPDALATYLSAKKKRFCITRTKRLSEIQNNYPIHIIRSFGNKTLISN